jgi:hypothetical protein
MEHMMHRQIIAAILGLGLLAAGGLADAASAAPSGAHRQPSAAPMQSIQPVHYDRHGPRYDRWHSWQRHVPRWSDRGHGHRQYGYDYRRPHHGRAD